MAVTASMVKELREMTGAGMMDCKKALVETDGNIEAAVDLLKEKGLAKAAKKAGRVAAMGLVKTAVAADGKSAAIVEVNSETDFVAKNEEFVTFVNDLAQLALTSDAADMDAFMALAYGEGTVQSECSQRIVAYRCVECFECLSGKGTSAFVADGYGYYHRYLFACVAALPYACKCSFDVKSIKACLEEYQVHSTLDEGFRLFTICLFHLVE